MDDFSGLGTDSSTGTAVADNSSLGGSSDNQFDGLGTDDTSVQPSQTPMPGTTQPPSDDVLGNQIENDAYEVGDILHPLKAAGALARLVPEGMQLTGGIIHSLAGNPTPQQDQYNYPKTALEKGTAIEQIPENYWKRGLGWLEGLGNQPAAQTTNNSSTGNDSLDGLGTDALNQSAQTPVNPLTTRPGEAPTYHDLIYNAPFMKYLSPEEREDIASNGGAIAELLGDPLWFVHLGGLIEAGEAAKAEGLLHPNIGNAAEAGQRALVTVGKTPIIKGAPVLKAIGAVQKGVRAAFPGFHTLTDNPVINQTIERTLKAPESNANHLADAAIGKPIGDAIKRNAKEMGITPGELSAKMMDYREGNLAPGPAYEPGKTVIDTHDFQPPESLKGAINAKVKDVLQNDLSPGSQSIYDQLQASKQLQALERQIGPIGNANELPGASSIENAEKAIEPSLAEGQLTPEEIREAIKQVPIEGPVSPEADKPGLEQFPPEIQQILRETQKANVGYALSEGLPPNANYLHHLGTPEYQKFLESKFNKPSGRVGSNTPTNDAIAAHQPQEIKMPATEANRLFQAGRGDEVFPNSPFKNLFKDFKGKVFSDDIAQIEANRYLQNAKVTRVSNFMKAVDDAFGKTKAEIGEGVENGTIKPKDYTPVKSDHFDGGERWFPKQLADFMDGVQNPQQADRLQGWSKNFIKNTSTFTKLVNFGWKVPSAPFNYLSNLNLAYLNKGLDPIEVAKGLKNIAADRLGKLSDETTLHSPLYGDISERDLMDKAHQYRGIGMGLESSEIANAGMPDILRNNRVSKTAMGVHMFAEDASRLPVFRSFLKQGYTWEGAAKATREALYDYSDLGRTDQKIAQYIPFYRFARMNMPKMVERMISEPARTFAVEKAREWWNRKNNQEENENALPDYRRLEEPWFAGNDEQGNPQWVQGGRYMTQNDINRPLGARDENGQNHFLRNFGRYAASMVNPFLKTPFEEAFNYNTATGTPIARDELANGGFGEETNLAPGLDMPSKIAYAFNQLSPFSQARVMADPTLSTSRKLLHELLGINAYTQQPEVDKMYQELGEKKDIKQLENNVRLFATKQANDLRDGKDHQAQLDQENYDNALKELEEYSQKVLQ